MATANHNLSNYNKASIAKIEGLNIGILQSEWNDTITNNLTKGAMDTLLDLGYESSQIQLWKVPGSFELIYGANQICKTHQDLDALIIVGCVIRGETAHFDFVCDAVTKGTTELNLTQDIPVIFCLLTDNNIEQSIARSGGAHGNKGVEAAITAVKMVAFKRGLNS